MLLSVQKNFRYYVALVLMILLAVGVRMQAAPLGAGLTENDIVSSEEAADVQSSTSSGEVASR